MKQEMKHLSQDQLKQLYFDYTRYRDNKCNGWADKSVEQFYNENSHYYKNSGSVQQ